MTINLSMPQQPTELRPKIIVFGVGGADTETPQQSPDEFGFVFEDLR